MVRVSVSDRIYGQRRPTVFSSDATRGLQTFCGLVTSKHTMAKGVQQCCCVLQGAPSFSTLIFHDFCMTKKMKIRDLSAQHIFPSKQ